jgi:hypothetical protein
MPLLVPQETDVFDRWGIWEAATPAATPPRLDGVRVLFADDDADGREVFTMILELAGVHGDSR